ncbi:MAG TPA: hypothetical protein PK040_02515 [Anaerolineaceae bacterium]|nr:hypothetical protein [Anaerolineaceae bacterium]
MEQTLNKVTAQIELAFWKVAIPLLTRSKLLQTIVTKMLTILNNPKTRRQAALVIMVAFLGFATGMLTYSFTVLLS